MARILITSGPTRQYLDPVRYLTNASSGLMGAAIAEAALAAGHEVIVVSGPVSLEYDPRALVIPVTSTDEMLTAATDTFQRCDGLIGVAAPCDYRPQQVEDRKITKTGKPLLLELHETPDIVATLGASKGDRWVVGFALETNDHHFRAIAKMERKCCDLIVLNSPAAMDSTSNSVELLAPNGEVVLTAEGPKRTVARQLFAAIEQRLIRRSAAATE